MSRTATARPFIRRVLAQGPMSARELAKAGDFHIRSVQRTIIEMWDDGEIHRVAASPSEPRAYRYSLGATSAQALPRVLLASRNQTAGTKPEAPPVIARDPLQERLFGKAQRKITPVRDPFQTMFFGASK